MLRHIYNRSVLVEIIIIPTGRDVIPGISHCQVKSAIFKADVTLQTIFLISLTNRVAGEQRLRHLWMSYNPRRNILTAEPVIDQAPRPVYARDN